MEDKKVLNSEEPENEKQKLSEDKLKQVSGGGIVLRPSSDLQPKHPGDGNLL